MYFASYDKHLCSIAGPCFTQFVSPTECCLISKHLTRHSIFFVVGHDRICLAHFFRFLFGIFFMDGSIFEALLQTTIMASLRERSLGSLSTSTANTLMTD